MTPEELREKMISTVESYHIEMGYGKETKQWAREEVDILLTAYVQAERKRILDATIAQFPMGDGTYIMIRTSVLNPEETL